ncbi:Fic family protein [Leptospirillum ferriphilum]|uniref:Addiction module protein n=1 Tax=Leptospirillum ferriphilum TaxID=178606 RepID=A0A1V3SVJ7_9BACT|nr:Fic family protein [Leptospirillum ferriphilum]OOH72896.1 addiction module protein [Leptospirillum ferriphilum]
MIFDRNRPFNDLPLLPPPVELETRPVLKKVISATRALAELKGVANLIPDQAILINGIILQEARLSSEIENIVTTSDDLYRAASDKLFQGESATKEVLRYREALWHGFDSLKSRPLSTNLFVEIVKIIRQVDSGIRRAPGTVIANPAGEVIYTPPEGESVIREKLANLESFMHSDNGLDPLVKLAAIHYQFEAIHPFPDGNGRTGRIINILFLVEKGLLDLPILYLSHYIIQKKSEYYRGLRAVTEEQRWEQWVLYVLDAIETTAYQTIERISQIRALMEKFQGTIQEKAPHIYSKDLIELVFQHPYCKIQFLIDAKIARRQTASQYLKTLASLNLLNPVKRGREIYYVNESLITALS